MSTNAKSSSSPLVHLICGPTAAGKSTYANALKNKTGAILFSIDDWMTSLFAPDLKNPMDWQWISERVLRCENRMLLTACSLAEAGVSSILEISLQRAEKRAEVATTIRESGSILQTHFLDVDATQRWKRVEQRNSDKGDTFSLEVTRGMFDFFEDMWEPPSETELLSLNGSKQLSVLLT